VKNGVNKWVHFLAFIAGDGSRVVDGIPQELVDRMRVFGRTPGHCSGGCWRTGGNEDYEFAVTPYEPEIYKYVALEMLSNAGAELMMYTVFSDVILQDGIIKSIKGRCRMFHSFLTLGGVDMERGETEELRKVLKSNGTVIDKEDIINEK
jgi:hypothetical protein